MRHSYDLTDETRKVLTNRVNGIADEMDVSDKYLYAILSGDKTDPFGPFAHLYAGAARHGAPTELWRHKLDAIDARYTKQAPKKTEIECLTDKINANADTTSQLVEALSDGVIDSQEAERIQKAIDKERSTLDLLEAHLQFKVELKAVGGKR
jgi:hypothetical protein